MNELIQALEWRYATKSFDPIYILSSKEVEILKKAVQLSVSSFGLQSYKVFIISDPKVKQGLKAAAFDQKQIEEAPLVFLFAHHLDYQSTEVEQLIEGLAKSQNRSPDDLMAYQNSIDKWMRSLSEAQLETWMSSQVHIAMNNLLIAAASMRLDTCPIGGFKTAQVDELLGLKEQNLRSCLLVPVGKRSALDPYAQFLKTRKSLEELFEEL